VQEPQAIQPPGWYADIVRSFTARFPRAHLSHHPLDGAVASQAWTNYLASLDPQKTYFLPADLDEFRAEESRLADGLKKGDVSFAYRAFDAFRERVMRKDGATGSVNDLDAEWVLQKYLSAFAHAYDPYSDYLCPTMAEHYDIRHRLSLVGIGVIFSLEQGTVNVVELVPGGPAERDTSVARLKPGDRIVAVAQGAGPAENIVHQPLSRILSLVRGTKGSRVVLTAVSPSDSARSSPRPVALVRAEVNVEALTARGEVREARGDDGIVRKVGVIRLPAFYGDGESGSDAGAGSSTRAVRGLLAHIQTQQVDGVILDLRNNGGGSLPEAVGTAGLFIRSGPVLQVLRGKRVEVIDDPDSGIAYSGPLVVLVNGMTASAAELVAGTLQDYGRAVIVGDDRTYGKGTCQNTYTLGRTPRLGAIHVTTLAYFRVSGESPHAKGVTPDIVLPSLADQRDRVSARETPFPPVKKADYSAVADLSAVLGRLKDAVEKRKALQSDAGDPVLDASCAILADLTTMTRKESRTFDEAPIHRSLWRRLVDWF